MKAPKRQKIDADGPQPVRQLAKGGQTAVMKSRWRDPEDVSPNATKKPRQIAGYRTFCPLRRMMAGRGSRITERQVMAADRLRAAVDLAVIGLGQRSMLASGTGFGPSQGPSASAIMQSLAHTAVQKVLARFAPSQRLMLTEIILLNRSLYAWTAAQATARVADANVEMGKLISILEVLEDHYGPEIDADMAAGRAA